MRSRAEQELHWPRRARSRWYFLTADYAFGHALEADTSAVVKAMGGEVVGSTRYPPETFDQSSFLLQAQSSKAQVVALAGSGNVLVNSIKSAQEFGIQKGGQTLAGLLVWITDVKSLGLRRGAGAGADERLLLGSRRRDARLVEAVLRADEAYAAHGRRRRLFVDHALPARRSRPPARTKRRPS